MAITSGIHTECYDLVEVGGIFNIYVTDLDNLATVTVNGGASTHDYTNLTGTVPWAMFNTKPSTASWATTSSKENGVTKWETTVSWYVPNITSAKSFVAEAMKNGCLVAVATFRSGVSLTCGISVPYEGFGHGSKQWLYNQTFSTMTIEQNSGSDFADDQGGTISIVASSFEVPRTYSGTITPAAGNLTAALA
jgi:hypothetical protein